MKILNNRLSGFKHGDKLIIEYEDGRKTDRTPYTFLEYSPCYVKSCATCLSHKHQALRATREGSRTITRYCGGQTGRFRWVKVG